MHSEVLRAALESLDDGVIVAGRDGTIIHANARLNAVWAMPADWKPLTTKNVFKDLSPRVTDPVAAGARFRHLRDNLDERSYDLVELKDGRLMERLAVPLRIDGKTEGKIWVYRDLVDRLQFESFGNDRAAANGELATLAIDVAREINAGRLPWSAGFFLALLEIGEAALRDLMERHAQFATVDLGVAQQQLKNLIATLPEGAPECLRTLDVVARADAALPVTACSPAALAGGLIPVEIIRARLQSARDQSTPRAPGSKVRVFGAGNSVVVAAGDALAWSNPAMAAQELVEHARESALLARFALAFSFLSGFASTTRRADSEAFRFELSPSSKQTVVG